MRALIALAELRSFSRAAQQIGVSQSALSQSIRQIEERIGVDLFDRGRGGVKPTAFGEVLIDAAKTSLSALDKAAREIASLQSMDAGELAVGVDPFLVSSVLGPV